MGPRWKEVLNMQIDLAMKSNRKKTLTRLSPFSFVILAGKPAGSACSKISICPALAASYIRAASPTAAGGSEESLISTGINAK